MRLRCAGSGSQVVAGTNAAGQDPLHPHRLGSTETCSPKGCCSWTRQHEHALEPFIFRRQMPQRGGVSGHRRPRMAIQRGD